MGASHFEVEAFAKMMRRRLMVAGVLVVGVLVATAGIVFAAGVGAVNNGTDSSADGDYSTVGGGLDNEASGFAATVSGGRMNRATGDYSAIVGGGCTPSGEVCASGTANLASGMNSFIGGGWLNTASGFGAVVLGSSSFADNGEGNEATGGGSAVLTGGANVASGNQSAIVSGDHNSAQGDESMILGGDSNSARGRGSTILHGEGSVAEGDESLVVGEDATATHTGAMIFATGSDNAESARGHEFAIYADGGVRIVTGEGQSLTLNGQDILSLIQSQQSAIEDLEERIAALEDGESGSPQPPGSINQILEAEDGDLSSPFETSTDSDASDGEYISATSGSNTSSPDEEASLSFSVPEDGTYYLWARLYGPDEDSDAIYIGIDGSWARTHPASTDEYQWVRVARSGNSISGPYGFSLEQGDHEINVGHAELHARLDALFVTDDQDARP